MALLVNRGSHFEKHWLAAWALTCAHILVHSRDSYFVRMTDLSVSRSPSLKLVWWLLPHRVAEAIKWYPAVRSLVHAWHTESGQPMLAITKHENCPPHSWACCPDTGRELQPKACWVPAVSLLLEVESSPGEAPPGTHMFGGWIPETLMTWHIVFQEKVSHRPRIPPPEGTAPPKLVLTLYNPTTGKITPTD